MLALLTGLSAAAACLAAPTTAGTAIEIDVERLATSASPLNKQLMSLSIESVELTSPTWASANSLKI